MQKILYLILIMVMFCGCSAKADHAADTIEMAAAPAEAFDSKPSERSGGTGAAVDGSSGVSAECSTEQAEPLVWAAFSRLTDGVTADNGTKLFTCQGYLPSFRTQDPDTDRWLEEQVSNAAKQTLYSVEDTRNQATADYASRGDDASASFYAYSYYSSVSTERMDTRVLSVLQINSTYSGGAHPNYAQIAYNMDLKRQIQLSLADVLQAGKEQDVLKRVLGELERRLSDLENFGLFTDYRSTVESYFEEQELTPYWYFTSSGMTIYFNCYDIAPYAAGIIKVELPYDSLHDILKAEYFPEKKAPEEGSATLPETPGERFTLPVESEGEPFYISANGILYDVKIHKISGWLNNDVPLVGQIIFAANRLTSCEAIELNQAQNSSLPEYLISYHTGDGSIHSFAIGIGEIREIVLEIAE